MQVKHEDASPDVEHPDCPILISLFGGFQLFKLGRPMSVRSGGKTEGLLSSLALRRRYRVPRETLLAAVWPEMESELASQSLHSLVYSLHKQLGDALDGAAPVLVRDGSYSLNTAAGVGVDVEWFENRIATGERLQRMEDVEGAAAAYTSAVRSYIGDLSILADIHSIVERERLRSRYLTLLSWLADYHYSREEYATCLEYAMQLLEHDPCREDAHRMVMRCHVRRGERAQALRQYRICENVLRMEFDAVPERVTTALFDQVRLDPASI